MYLFLECPSVSYTQLQSSTYILNFKFWMVTGNISSFTYGRMLCSEMATSKIKPSSITT